jgi:hypothetical protein
MHVEIAQSALDDVTSALRSMNCLEICEASLGNMKLHKQL